MIRLKVQETSQRFRIITQNPVSFTVESGIPLYPEEYAGPYEATPTETEQTLETDGLMMTDDVTVGAIDSEYVGSDVPRRSALNVDGLNVSASAGYYVEEVSATVTPNLQDVSKEYSPSTTDQTETFSAGSGYDGIGDVSVTVNAAPLQEKSRTVGASGTYEDTADSGYYGLSKVTNTVPSGSMSIVYDTGFTTVNNNRKWRFRGTSNVNPKGWFNQGNNYGSYISYDALEATTVTPTESQQTVGGVNTMMEGAVTVGAISSTYVGSGIPRKSSSDLSVSGRTITAPSGYYENNASASVSNDYIIPSGSQTYSTNGTYNVTSLAQVVVDTPTYTDGDNLEYGTAGLVGTTWLFNDTLTLPNTSPLYNIDFSSNSQTYTSMYVVGLGSAGGSVTYGNEMVYVYISPGATTKWNNQAYRTITITGGTDATNQNLIDWITANATQQ